MKIKKITLFCLVGFFGLIFTACQEEDVKPTNDHVLKTEGDSPKEAGHDDFNN